MRVLCSSLCAIAFTVCTNLSAAESDALDIFQKRIATILASKNPSSCSDFHLSGVDMKNYIYPDPGKTFAALKSAGLIDVAKPA